MGKVRFFDPGAPLLKTLVSCIKDHPQPERLAQDMVIFLPTQRTVKHVMGQLIQEKPATFLPTLIPLGDFEQLKALLPPDQQALFPPPIKSDLRRLLLAQLLTKGFYEDLSLGAGFKLAKELADLMDSLAHQGKTLENLITEDLSHFGTYWQQSQNFLKQLQATWPPLLEDLGLEDRGIYQYRLMQALVTHIQSSRLQDKTLILAGSTGSQTITHPLMKALQDHPKGELWLYKTLSPHLSADHPSMFPYKTLKRLNLETQPEALSDDPFSKALFDLAKTTPSSQLQERLQRIKLFEAPTEEEEIQALTTLVCHHLSHPEKPQVVVVCPDDQLMRQLRLSLEAEGIAPDYSLGTPFSQTKLGRYLKLLMHLMDAPKVDLSLLDLLQSPLTKLAEEITPLSEQLHKLFIHRPQSWQSLLKRLPDHFREKLTPLFAASSSQSWDAYLKRLLTLLTHFTGLASPYNKGSTDPDDLQMFQTFEEILESLQGFRDLMPTLGPGGYQSFLTHYLDSIHVRPVKDQHPRLLILDTREARMIPTDVMILAGLNEGIWPRFGNVNPWVPTPLAEAHGLSQPESLCQLMAHDFLCNLQANRVYLTRSQQSFGQSTQPSRFIQRLKTLAEIQDVSLDVEFPARPIHATAPAILSLLEAPLDPPVSIALTQLEAYAKGFTSREAIWLGLRDKVALAPPTSQDWGILLHSFMEQAAPTLLTHWYDPDQGFQESQQIYHRFLQKTPHHPLIHGLWREQGEEALHWLCHFHASLPKPQKIFTEVPGKIALNGVDVTARFDRIDRLPNGAHRLIDYKTGTLPTPRQIQKGEAFQLSFGAHMLSQKSLEGVDGIAQNLYYIGMKPKQAGGAFTKMERGDFHLETVVAQVQELIDEILSLRTTQLQRQEAVS